MQPNISIAFPEDTVEWKDLLSTDKNVFRTITLDNIKTYFIKRYMIIIILMTAQICDHSAAPTTLYLHRHAEASRNKGKTLAVNIMIVDIKVYVLNVNVFILFTCKAEMLKYVLYKGKIHVNKTVGINSTSCTCRTGAGFSAACKHVAAALYVLEYYGKTGN